MILNVEVLMKRPIESLAKKQNAWPPYPNPSDRESQMKETIQRFGGFLGVRSLLPQHW